MTLSNIHSRLIYDDGFPIGLFNDFENVETADAKRQAASFDSEVAPFVGDVLRSTGLSETVGVSLMHKHWGVVSGEIPIRREFGGGTELKMIVRPECRPAHEYQPIAWAFDRRSDGTIAVAPIEFSVSSSKLNANFFDRLMMTASQSVPFLQARGLDNLFGFALRNTEPLASDEVWLEESFVERASIIKKAKAEDASEIISTFWQFHSCGVETECRMEWACNPAGDAHHRVPRHI